MKTIRISSAILCLAALSASAIAATPEDEAKQAVVTVSLTNVPTAQAIQFVGAQSGVKAHYIAPAKDDPKVSLSLNNVSAASAYQYIAAMASLTVEYKADGAYFTAKK